MKKTEKNEPKRCMKCGQLVISSADKCPFCGGKLTENKSENKKQYLAD